jgi:CheY-like chemotaxis protein
MKLSSHLHNQIHNETLNQDERICLQCQVARRLEEAGEYESACAALGELWTPKVAEKLPVGLDEAIKGEVFLRVGVLTGWIGSAQQIEGSQDVAKDLISHSLSIFENLQEQAKIAEAQTDLAYCYWRQGGFDEARVFLRDALTKVPAKDCALRAVVCLRSALLENSATRFNDSLRILNEGLPLFQRSDNHALLGKFHNTLGLALKNLGDAERREDYIDQAFIEYTAASFHFEQAGHLRYCARVENNLGYLYSTINQFSDAHARLDRARTLFFNANDCGSVAQVDDTRARVFLAEGKNLEAERTTRSAVRTLGRGGEQALLAEALTTRGIALARIGRHRQSLNVLRQAVQVAETAGDLEAAGRALLSIVEEPDAQLRANQLVGVFRSACDLLAHAQDDRTKQRLISCGMRILGALHSQVQPLIGEASGWENFSFREHIIRCERVLIERALRDADGVVTHAARLLGFKHHQSLVSLLNHRHKDLINARSAIRPRRRGLVSRSRAKVERSDESKIHILHVADNDLLARVIRSMLALNDWIVKTRINAEAALKELKSYKHYDLLLFDYQLPGLNGIDLVRLTRKISHRRRTPIVMFSGGDCETEAWRAGVDAFLRKEDDMENLQSTINRLLRVESEEE